jgi:hypothetical protein
MLYNLDNSFLGSEGLTAAVIKYSVFWDTIPRSPSDISKNMSPPFTGSKNKPSKNQHESDSKHNPTLKIEATCCSETSVDFQRATRRCNPKDRTL